MELIRLQRERTDADLIAALRAGSTDALAELYQRYAAAVLRVAWRLLGSTADAEDVTHDVFVGLPEAVQRYRERGRFGAWLQQVTVRVALSRLRHRVSRKEGDLALASASVRAASVDAAEQAEIARAIAQLPNALRIVFVLKVLEGYSHAEIAQLAGISVTASEVRLSRALKQLRQRLDP
jgi:RNA polymerase sigma-70 factor, ECF subfamily